MRYIKVYSLIFFYILSCLCIVVDFHYCGGELASVALYHVDEQGCCGENEGEIPGCCEDKLVVVDTDDYDVTQKYLVKRNNIQQAISFFPSVQTTIVDNNLVLEQTILPINHAPPNSLQAPIFIKNKVLLI